MKITDQVAEFAKPVVEANGCELWDVEYVREGSEYFLRLYIDKEGGVDISDCEAISRAVDPILDERDPDAREFAAAAETVNGLIDECGDNRELFSFRLREATYSLEPDEGDAILTDGWLELPFLDADELIVTGFNEGRVP